MRCRDVSDGGLGDHFGEAVVEFNVERWGSERRLGILRRYPYPVYGTAGPVAEAALGADATVAQILLLLKSSR